MRDSVALGFYVLYKFGFMDYCEDRKALKGWLTACYKSEFSTVMLFTILGFVVTVS